MPSNDTRFHKGKSGNPNGRPKGSKNSLGFAADFLSEANEQIAVSVDGKRKIMSVVRAGIKQLLAKAAAGDLPAIKHTLDRLEALEEAAAKVTPKETYTFTQHDQEIIEHVYANLAPNADQTGQPAPRPEDAGDLSQ